MRFAKLSLALSALFTVALTVGCPMAEPAKPAPTASLYERLGKEPAISAVVDEFVKITAANPKVNFFRKDVAGSRDYSKEFDAAPFKKKLVAFIAAATGKPGGMDEYTKMGGRSMKESHAGMKITKDEFMAMAGDLEQACKNLKVPAPETTELVAVAATTLGDIVEVK